MDTITFLQTWLIFATLALFFLTCYARELLSPEVFYVGLLGAGVVAVLFYCQTTPPCP